MESKRMSVGLKKVFRAGAMRYYVHDDGRVVLWFDRKSMGAADEFICRQMTFLSQMGRCIETFTHKTGRTTFTFSADAETMIALQDVRTVFGKGEKIFETRCYIKGRGRARYVKANNEEEAAEVAATSLGIKVKDAESGNTNVYVYGKQ